MSTSILLILLLVAIIALWLDGARARELASAVAAELCRRHGYQFLDDTVALIRFGISRSADGLRLRRMFRYDYSMEGVGRRNGIIIMRGTHVEYADLGEDDESPGSPPPPEAGSANTNVLPFKRRR